MVALVVGSVASAGYALIVASGVFVDTVAGYFRVGNAATGFGVAMSLALVGAGYLIGISVGLAILTGLIIAWGILTPILTAAHPVAGPAAEVALDVWRHQVRFIGAGTIGIAAIWTIGEARASGVVGISSAIAASRRRADSRTPTRCPARSVTCPSRPWR